MNGLTAWLEKYFIPVAGKIGAQKHLVALRDAFIGTLPLTMAGSIAVMINAIIRDLPPAFFPDYDGNTIPVIKEIIGVDGVMWNGTLAVVGIAFAFSWGYNLARAYKVNELAGGMVALAALLQGISFGPSITATLAKKVPDSAAKIINDAQAGATIDGDQLQIGLWGWLKLGHLDANAYFTIMIMGAIAVILFAKLTLANITIKLPDSVPPAVSTAFTAILPAMIALYVTAIIHYVFGKITNGQLLIDWIQKNIAEPFMGLSQGIGAVLIVTFFVSFLWFFGIHGPNVLAPVLEGIWGQGQLKNINVFQNGFEGKKGAEGVLAAIDAGKGDAYMWVRGSFDSFAWFGGSGGTITLLIMILLLSKRADYRAVAKLGIGPGIFNINEPVMFGLPIVLNPIFFIPFIVAPMVATTIGYVATSLHLVNPVVVAVPWVVPPFLMSFLATGADWRAPVVTLVAFAATLVIWAPFVLAANSMEED
ncbi:MAG: PTS transporter subunit EIIC [Lactobacillales bacterium]|jgi:PTS system cellobiose-specific IIC component|nr:PTS transporter subunit EIIC [Lactobacillales bacterium]